MKTAFLKTLAAGLSCVCLAGICDSASAQFFDHNGILAPTNRLPAQQYNDGYDRRLPQQRHDLNRLVPPANRRYLRTKATDEGLAQDDLRLIQDLNSYRGRCGNGQCQHKRGERRMDDETNSYQGRRSQTEGYTSGGGYQSGRSVTTGWDPSNVNAIDPETSLRNQRSYRGEPNHAEGSHRRGHGQCRDCINGQCDCPAGQYGARTEQRGFRNTDPRNAPSSGRNSNLTRRDNINRQYQPTRSLYLN